MAFRFPLETLRRLREGMERQEELRLQRVIAQLAQARKEMETLQLERQAAWSEAKQRLADSAAAAELHFELARDEVMQQRALVLRQRIQSLEEERKRQQLAYQKARQDREILDNLRERQRERYDLEQGRREQQAVDDMQQLVRAGRAALESE